MKKCDYCWIGVVAANNESILVPECDPLQKRNIDFDYCPICGHKINWDNQEISRRNKWKHQNEKLKN